jgi:hypothetical protein
MVLALLWYGRQFLEISSSFFSLLSKSGFSFLQSLLPSRCTNSLIEQYLDHIGSKCNRAALGVLVNVLALLWCGRQFLEIIHFFLSSRSQGFLFAFSNCTDGFMHLSKQEMKHETNVITILTKLRSVALK